MRGPGGRPFPVRLLAVAALLMLVCSGLSLDRADKLASIAGLFVALAAFAYTNRSESSAAPTEATPEVAPTRAVADPVPGGDRVVALLRGGTARLRGLLLSGPRIPLGAAVAAAVAVGLIGITIAYLAGPPESPSAKQSLSPSPSSGPAWSPSSDPASTTPDVVDCPLPGSLPTTSSSTATVRRSAQLKLPALYYADLDSTCPDWGIGSGPDSARHDIVNDGTGVWHSSSDTEIAPLERGRPATYDECLKETDYLASTVSYAELKPGDRYCVKTIDRDSTRQSLVTVVSLQRSESGRTVILDVRTWATTRPADESDDSWAIAAGIVIALMVFAGGGGAAAASKGRKGGKGKKTRDRKDA